MLNRHGLPAQPRATGLQPAVVDSHRKYGVTDLESVGITAAIVVLAAGLGWSIVRHKLEFLFEPPKDVHLVVELDPRRLRFVQRYHSDLEALGFEKIGAYRVPEIPGLVVYAFAQTFKKVCAIVYRHPVAGVFVDMFSATESGNALTVSNAPSGGNREVPPLREKIIDQNLELDEIYQRLLRERPVGPYQLIDVDNFVTVFEGEYRRETAWRARRRGTDDPAAGRAATDPAAQADPKQLQARYAGHPTGEGD